MKNDPQSLELMTVFGLRRNISKHVNNWAPDKQSHNAVKPQMMAEMLQVCTALNVKFHKLQPKVFILSFSVIPLNRTDLCQMFTFCTSTDKKLKYN